MAGIWHCEGTCLNLEFTLRLTNNAAPSLLISNSSGQEETEPCDRFDGKETKRQVDQWDGDIEERDGDQHCEDVLSSIEGERQRLLYYMLLNGVRI